MLDEVTKGFKAGKDLAISDGTLNTMEAKLPALVHTPHDERRTSCFA